MKITFEGVGKNLIIASLAFVLFFLVFEDRTQLPAILQTFGRFHPMVLHFPIALLLLSMIFEYLRFKPIYSENSFLQTFLSGLMLTGILFCALTVIMGLFLSREEGYAGPTLLWHKWLGVALFFYSTAIYIFHKSPWYKRSLAGFNAATITIMLLLTGHYGASLTHGEDFVYAPLKATTDKPVVALKDAFVFTDVVQPILQKKCISCHSPDKIKGELLLTDEKSILKGGKSGAFIVPSNPELSSLLQRIHLPEDNKEHMPPKGKPQLTEEEMQILYLWVKNKADFKGKVTALPEKDSLRILASAYLSPGASNDESSEYTFAAAKSSVIEKLSNNYRVITTLAEGSPALSVNFYDKARYSTKTVDELKEINEQIISLNLSKMPIKDADLKVIANFANLTVLNLNYTEITFKGLKEFGSLKKLRQLSIVKTKGSLADLKAALIQLPELKKIYIWQTGLVDKDIQQLARALPKLKIINGYKDDGSVLFKLNEPRPADNIRIFSGSKKVILKHTIKGVELRYTTNGFVPDSLKSELYKDGVMLSENTILKVRAFKKGWISSNTAEFKFLKSMYRPNEANFLTPNLQKYPSDGTFTLFDGELGDFNAFTGNWVVFDKPMGMQMKFVKAISLNKLTLCMMYNPGTRAYLPEKVTVWGRSGSGPFKLISEAKVSMHPQEHSPALEQLNINCTGNNLTGLKLIVTPIKIVPAWDAANKGVSGLLFIQEVLIN